MTNQLLEISRLVKSPLNVRRTGSKAACDELKASILAHGLMQNLVVTEAKGGKYHVIAGARRLEALLALQSEGKLPPDYAAPCQIVTEQNAPEMSLAENIVRQAMHPADEFEAFAKLAEQGQTAQQIAERFGTTEKRVLQRLKLGRVAPELLDEYRDGAIKLETLEAFTVTDDRKRQLDLYRGLQGWQKDNAHHIRSVLTERMAEADDKLAKFVTLEAYEAAGGMTKTDLFGDEVYLEDAMLLQRLAGEKLEAEAEKLRSDGWGWVEVNFDRDYSFLAKHGRIQPVPLDAPAELIAEKHAIDSDIEAIEQEWDEADADDEDLLDSISVRKEDAESRLEAIEEKLESFKDFDPEQKKNAGCYVSISYGGKLDIEKGLVKPEDRMQAAKAQVDELPADAKPSLPQSLIDDLKRYRTQVAQVAIAENPSIAFDLLVFGAASNALSLGSFVKDGPKVSFQNQFVSPSVEADTPAAGRLEAIREALPLSWLEEDNEAARFIAFQRLSEADKQRLLAYCTALTLQVKLASENRYPTAYDSALSQTGANVAGYWRPTAGNYLSRIKRDQLLEIGRQIHPGNEHWLMKFKDAKKTALVAELNETFAKSKNTDTRDAIRNWLPEGMEIGKAEQPEPKVKKGRKAA